jgi:hypothetical protein
MNRDISDDNERDEDLEGALAALRRAKKRAEDLAIATGTSIIESDGDKIVSLSPEQILERRRRSETK